MAAELHVLQKSLDAVMLAASTHKVYFIPAVAELEEVAPALVEIAHEQARLEMAA